MFELMNENSERAFLCKKPVIIGQEYTALTILHVCGSPINIVFLKIAVDAPKKAASVGALNT
jgi:hypothetical protein